jgi:uncharacterized membrane protein
MAFCNQCGTPISDGATICAACAGRAPQWQPGPQGQGQPQGLTDNTAGILAYITIIPAIIFLVMEPYNRNRYIRFHSFQCLFFAAALVVLHLALGVLSAIPFMVVLTVPLHALVSLGGFIVWIVLLVKASQGLMYKLPVIGDMAERQANAM